MKYLMKRRMLFTSTAAALGAGLVAATALAQQPGAPPATTTRPAMSPEDRAAFIDARIAAIRAGLKLTPEQEKLWPPVETAARDMARQAQEARATRKARTQSDDPVERMSQMGEDLSQRGTAMIKVATAARPLYASLSDDQKRRLKILMPQAGGERHGDRHRENGMMGRHRDHRGWNDQL